MDTIAEQAMPEKHDASSLESVLPTAPRHNERRKEMSRDYGALRLWSTVLIIIGISGVIFVVIGVIRHDRGCHLLAGACDPPYRGTLGPRFASWPIALGRP